MFNPAMGSQANVMEQAELIMATLFLLAVNGHHLFIQGLAQSFELVPVSSIGIKYEGFTSVALAVRECFFMGIKMAAPVMVAIFITNVTMGLLGSSSSAAQRHDDKYPGNDRRFGCCVVSFDAAFCE